LSLDPQPLQDHGEGFFTWHAYDPTCKAELWSTAFLNKEVAILFDPIDWPQNNPHPMGPIQLVTTNANHDRNCKWWMTLSRSQLTTQPPGFQTVPLAGAGEKEAAYFHGKTGTLVVGDALIHLAPNPLMPLPDKYCTDPHLLKASLNTLLRLPIRRIFFAHGAPILQDGLHQIRKLFP